MTGVYEKFMEATRRRVSCNHPGAPPVSFDATAAKVLTSEDVKRLFPRGNYYCRHCGCNVILYASEEHYYAGDW